MRTIEISSKLEGKHQWGIYLCKRFQGLGFLFSFDNGYISHDYFLIEIKLLWLKVWYTYELKKKLIL